MNLKGFKLAALLAAIVNLIASIVMLFILDHGLNPNHPIEYRFDYLTTHPITWKLSWLSWIFAAIALIFFLVQWGHWIKSKSNGRYDAWIAFGVIIGCLGLVPDTIAEVVYMHLLPQLATLPEKSSFLQWESLAQFLTGFLGNGLYCVGGFTLQCVSLKTKTLPTFCRYFGFVIWLFGFMLSASVFIDWFQGIYAFTALTMASFVIWAFAVSLLRHPAD